MSKREPLGHFASSLNLPEQHFFALPYNFNMHMHVKQSGTGLDTKSTILRVSVCVCVWGGGNCPKLNSNQQPLDPKPKILVLINCYDIKLSSFSDNISITK